MAAVTIYSVEGLAGLGGRLLLRAAGDRRRQAVLIAGLLMQALRPALFYTRGLGEFYAVAAVFGRLRRRDAALRGAGARLFPPRIMGTVFGAATMVSSLGMALGPAIGGWIFDRFGSYSWMYSARWRSASVRRRSRSFSRRCRPPARGGGAARVIG